MIALQLLVHIDSRYCIVDRAEQRLQASSFDSNDGQKLSLEDERRSQGTPQIISEPYHRESPIQCGKPYLCQARAIVYDDS